jgi:uncharacterized protein YigE (DUF2233 family)
MLRMLMVIAVLVVAFSGARAAGPCGPLDFDGNAYTVCRFDLRNDPLALYNLDGTGRPYGSFQVLAGALAADGKTLRFAMNAGMFDDDLKPIGLYVEAGRQLKALNLAKGPGNFHLKPNGVFWLKGNEGGVMETEAYAGAGLEPDYATQSGPMLVIDSVIHPRFLVDGTSLKWRNGVGMADRHHVVFAITEQPVNFHDFARLFRDGLGCPNALFLDGGSVPSLFDAETGRSDARAGLGPMVGLAN